MSIERRRFLTIDIRFDCNGLMGIDVSEGCQLNHIDLSRANLKQLQRGDRIWAVNPERNSVINPSQWNRYLSRGAFRSATQNLKEFRMVACHEDLLCELPNGGQQILAMKPEQLAQANAGEDCDVEVEVRFLSGEGFTSSFSGCTRLGDIKTAVKHRMNLPGASRIKLVIGDSSPTDLTTLCKVASNGLVFVTAIDAGLAVCKLSFLDALLYVGVSDELAEAIVKEDDNAAWNHLKKNARIPRLMIDQPWAVLQVCKKTCRIDDEERLMTHLRRLCDMVVEETREAKATEKAAMMSRLLHKANPT
eukprot:TRINITY_DN23206_c0_g1_i10.p1 TRINITY_DN23206_c0_g1~~TRINITY_DN23206_c0_g1_i10.p1  ORF type:complete len:305 (+),score=30.65 TRINITY_DN23206_c0_g1_i10:350-1264(+)